MSAVVGVWLIIGGLGTYQQTQVSEQVFDFIAI